MVKEYYTQVWRKVSRSKKILNTVNFFLGFPFKKRVSGDSQNSECKYSKYFP